MSTLLIIPDIFNFPPAQSPFLSQITKGQDYSYKSLPELLGEPELSGEALHHSLFYQGGLTRAVSALHSLGAYGFKGLGFSTGGTVLWAAAKNHPLLKSLLCISSTRLRFENERPAIPVQLYWGAHDPHRPNSLWNKTYADYYEVLPNAEHAFYRDITRTVPVIKTALSRV